MLGEGAYGRVYAGTFVGAEVAVKIFANAITTKAEASPFWSEVNILSQLRHPNIVLIMGVGSTPDSHYFIVSERLESDLRTYLNTTQLSKFQRFLLIRDLAVGLAYLHSRWPQIIHRDLKSENCLVTTKGELKVCDFGWSLPIDSDRVLLLTRPVGTVRFCCFFSVDFMPFWTFSVSGQQSIETSSNGRPSFTSNFEV